MKKFWFDPFYFFQKKTMKIHLHPTNFIPLLAIPAALAFSGVGFQLSPYTSWILAGMLFFSFLGLRAKDLLPAIQRPSKVLIAVTMILIVSPIVVYPFAKLLFPDFFLGAMLFMMLPAAVSSPAVAAIYGGNVGLATVDAVVSNLLSIITIPLFFGWIAHESVQMDSLPILRQMLWVILLPFALGMLGNHWLPKAAKAIHRHNRMINLFLLFFLFFAAFSPHIHNMIDSFRNFHLILALVVTHTLLHLLAKVDTWRSKNEADKVGILCNMVLPNVGLGVVLAQHYLDSPALMFILLSEVVWVVVVGFIHYLK